MERFEANDIVGGINGVQGTARHFVPRRVAFPNDTL